MSAELAVVGLGRMDYEEAWALQRAVASARIDGTLQRDHLLLVEHPPVITKGRAASAANVLLSPEQLAARHIHVHEVERGGDVTFHGPGQLVGYPIYNLNEHRPDLHVFLRQLEQALIAALDHFGIEGSRREGLTGVWVDNRKIASIGIHVKKWVTWHGFALNVMTDLTFFDLIVPCGIDQVLMTNMQKELNETAPRDLWGRALDYTILGFCETFSQQPQAVELGDLRHQLPAPAVPDRRA